jgi:hypothetical protein
MMIDLGKVEIFERERGKSVGNGIGRGRSRL